NGRLYDPVIARFFSPDPFVQMPNFTQSYNRYSYCLNNPLMYTDPSGEFVITFLVNAIIGWSKGENGWKAGGNAVWNSLKMVGGLFTSDKNKNGWTQTWEVISRLTWQLPQTILGFGFGQFQNTFGGVRSVNLYRGATVINSRWMSDGEAVTLGSYITGGNNIKADVNNSLFQHEYGHYIQSQYMGPAYLAKVGIPSLFGAGGNNIHDFQIYEQDANRRAFEYFNRREPGFYQTEEEYLYNESNGIRKGWDFYANPLDPTHETFRGTYYDYKNADHMLWLNNSLSLKARWYDIMMGFIDPLGLIMGSFNHIYNNQHRP
ncbi:endonuclease, partial [Bacteroidales bacterium OttesenSCG-928-L19]|nr:endonuclease [Bacteroidales bacterium OttesenSCG-928-L19]